MVPSVTLRGDLIVTLLSSSSGDRQALRSDYGVFNVVNGTDVLGTVR